MRLALTHNLARSNREEEAEFDTPATIDLLCAGLRSLGHTVTPVEVSGPTSRLAARLESLRPDLIFNTAEGHRGRYREAFFPALFDRLGLAYTGSDAHVCAITLDKQWTKRLVAEAGVLVPAGVMVRSLGELPLAAALPWPRIVKPNYEGSSKGITARSVVEDAIAERAVVEALLARYPEGVLVEQFIVGVDVSVSVLEGAPKHTRGVLEPASYAFDPQVVAGVKYPIYDGHLKVQNADAVTVCVPAALPDQVRRRVRADARRAVGVLGICDLGRLDFRVDEQGIPWFVEANALPSLEPGASLYQAAALVGLKEPADVLRCVLRTAAARQGVRSRPVRHPKVRVGLTFNVKRSASEAEFDSPQAISALVATLESLGHEVVALEADHTLPAILPHADLDVVFNTAEGWFGRHREAQVPALLELLGIPYTGSDPTCMALTLDKALAKLVVSAAGVATPRFFVMRTGQEALPKGFCFPAFIKPIAEGSSKGIDGMNVIAHVQALREQVQALQTAYGQPILVEEYLVGREFTVGLLGGTKPRVLPPLEIVFHPAIAQPFYAKTIKEACSVRVDPHPELSKTVHRQLRRLARVAFHALGCRDVARIDVRMDAQGRPHFMECNPLPGLTPGYSDLCMIAEAQGMSHADLVGAILGPALARRRQMVHRTI